MWGNVLGTAGVTLLLAAFVLNAMGAIPVSYLYAILNLFGAGLAAVASLLIGFIPFVVLESVWCLAAGWKLVSLHREEAVVGGSTSET